MSVLSGKPARVHPMDFAMQLLGSTSGLSALLAIAVQKKNLEWETWGKSPPWCNRSMERGTAGLLQGTHKTMGKGEGKKGGGGNRKIKRKVTL